MRYLLMIYSNEATNETRTAAETKAMYAEYGAFTGEVRGNGVMQGGDELMPRPRRPA